MYSTIDHDINKRKWISEANHVVIQNIKNDGSSIDHKIHYKIQETINCEANPV